VALSIHETEATSGFGYPHTWYVLILPMLPFLFRCLQCLRRYYDGLAVKAGSVQLINCFRYGLGLVVLLTIGFQTMHKNKGYWVYIVLPVRLVYSSFSLYWDTIMDWGLGQGRMMIKPTERQVLSAYPKWVYFLAITTNMIARFIWLPFLLLPVYQYQPSYGGYILGLIEIMRRFQWNFIRVEIEHVHNCEKYQVTAELHLPFTTTDLFTHEEDERDQAEPDDSDEQNQELSNKISNGGASFPGSPTVEADADYTVLRESISSEGIEDSKV
jgi:hypothetical protein